jgi:hypothetical protein
LNLLAPHGFQRYEWILRLTTLKPSSSRPSTQCPLGHRDWRFTLSHIADLDGIYRGLSILIDAENRLLLAQYEAKLAELQLKWLAGRLV